MNKSDIPFALEMFMAVLQPALVKCGHMKVSEEVGTIPPPSREKIEEASRLIEELFNQKTAAGWDNALFFAAAETFHSMLWRYSPDGEDA